MMPSYEQQVALLAEQKCDLIHLIGAPPFMVQGRKARGQDRRRLGEEIPTPIFTRGAEPCAALKALKAKSIVGATYFPDKLNKMFAGYLRDAGFDVRGMDGIDVPFDKVQELPSRADLCPHQAQLPEAQRRRRDLHARARAGARSTSSPSWNRICGVPVVHPVTARVWEIQKRLHMREPRRGLRPSARRPCREDVTDEVADPYSCSPSCSARRCRSRAAAQTVGAVLQGPHGHLAGRTSRRAASTTSRPASSASISAASSRAIRPSWCRTLPAAAASSPRNRLYNVAEKDGSVLAELGAPVPQLAIQGNAEGAVRSAKVQLARQPVVLCATTPI